MCSPTGFTYRIQGSLQCTKYVEVKRSTSCSVYNYFCITGIIFLFSKTPMPALGLVFKVYWVSFLGVKQLEHDVDHSTLSSFKVKNKWRCIYTPPVCLHGTDKNNFTVFTCNYKLEFQLTCTKNIMLFSQSSVFLTDITLSLLCFNLQAPSHFLYTSDCSQYNLS